MPKSATMYPGQERIYTIAIMIDRPALLEFAKELIGREITLEEVINLENQIESTIDMMTKDMDYLDKEWIESAIVNDQI